MKSISTDTRNRGPRRMAGLVLAGVLSLSSAAMADEWVPVGTPAPAQPVAPTPAAPAPVAPTTIPAMPAAPATPAVTSGAIVEPGMTPPATVTEDEMKARAHRQVLQDAYIHHSFVTQRLAAAKDSLDGANAAFETEKQNIAAYATDVKEKTATVNAIREQVEAKIAAVKEKYDNQLYAKTEEEFDLQDKLSKVGPVEYLPEREAARQTEIAMIKAQQAGVRDDIHVIRSQMVKEVEVERAALNAARADLRAAEEAYAANYGALADARSAAFQAEDSIRRYEAALPEAEARLAAAKKSYEPFGDPEAVIASTTMPDIQPPNYGTQSDDTLRLLQQMVAERKSMTAGSDEMAMTDAPAPVTTTPADPTKKPAPPEGQTRISPWAAAIPVAIVVVALVAL